MWCACEYKSGEPGNNSNSTEMYPAYNNLHSTRYAGSFALHLSMWSGKIKWKVYMRGKDNQAVAWVSNV